MPLYTGAAKATSPSYGVLNAGSLQQIPRSLYPGTSFFLFGTRTTAQLPLALDNVTAETPKAGQASVSMSLAQTLSSIVPNLGVELFLNANPSAANFQLQEADTDADAFYITPAPSTYTISAFTQVGAIWVARADIGTVGSNFVRLLCNANPNAVGVIARLTMQ